MQQTKKTIEKKSSRGKVVALFPVQDCNKLSLEEYMAPFCAATPEAESEGIILRPQWSKLTFAA